jgi:hypothetical protein
MTRTNQHIDNMIHSFHPSDIKGVIDRGNKYDLRMCSDELVEYYLNAEKSILPMSEKDMVNFVDIFCDMMNSPNPAKQKSGTLHRLRTKNKAKRLRFEALKKEYLNHLSSTRQTLQRASTLNSQFPSHQFTFYGFSRWLAETKGIESYRPVLGTL